MIYVPNRYCGFAKQTWPLRRAFVLLIDSFCPYFRISAGTENCHHFYRFVILVNEEMYHIRKFLHDGATDLPVAYSVYLRVFAQGINLPYNCFPESFAKPFLRQIVPVDNIPDVRQGFGFDFHPEFFHQAYSVFLTSSQSKSLSGSSLTLSKRSITKS